MNSAAVHVFLSAELFHPDLPGGLMRFFRYGPGLVERGIQPHVVTLHHKTGLADEETVNGIQIHRLPAPAKTPGDRLRPWLLERALQRALEIRKQGGRAVVQPNMLSHPMAPILLKARLQGVPSVFNISIAPEADLHSNPALRLRQLARMAVMCAPVNRLIFLSHQLQRQYLQRWKVRSSQVTIIPNGVDLKRFRPCSDEAEKAALRASLGFLPHEKVVLFVGGVMERKGVDILLEAWNAVTRSQPHAVLAIVGSHGLRISHDRDGYRDRLQDYLNRLENLRSGLEKPDSVRFLGEMADPAPCYRAADLFAFPSRREGLPNAVLEAMASALPCLVARFDGMPQDGEELGRSGEHFTVLDHNPAKWALEILRTLSHETSAESLQIGQSACSWICRNHDLQHSLDRWSTLYRNP